MSHYARADISPPKPATFPFNGLGFVLSIPLAGAVVILIVWAVTGQRPF